MDGARESVIFGYPIQSRNQKNFILSFRLPRELRAFAISFEHELNEGCRSRTAHHLAALLSLPFCSFKARPAGRDVFGERRVFVRSGSQAILFDALFGTGLPDYDRVPPTAMDEIERGKPPFANIDALLISHVHADHFNLPSTVRFLKTHPATIVVAPDQVSKQIHKALTGDSQALSRIHTATLEQNSITTRDEGGVRIGSFPLTHGNIENAAYLVVLDRRTVLHIGDADLPMKGLAQFGLSHRRIDLAFVPFWQLTDNPKRVQTLIAAKVVIPMHLITNPTTDTSKGFMEHVGGRERMLRQIRICFPNAAIFLAPLETKSF